METAADRLSYLQSFGVPATWIKSDLSTAAVSVVLFSIYSEMGASVCDYLVQTSVEMMGTAKLREKLTINNITYSISDIRPDETGWLDIQLER